jgi:hypothetical protein
MTEELFFTPSNVYRAGSLVEMGQLVVTALSTGNVTVQASTLVGQNRPGSTLNITVNQ